MFITKMKLIVFLIFSANLVYGQNFYVGHVVSIGSDNGLIVGTSGTQKNFRLKMEKEKYYANITFSESAVKESLKLQQKQLAESSRLVEQMTTGGSMQVPMSLSPNESIMVNVSSTRFYEELKKMLGDGSTPKIEVYGHVNEQKGVVHAKHVTLYVTLDEPL